MLSAAKHGLSTDDKLKEWLEQLTSLEVAESYLACMFSCSLERVGHDWVTELNWTELRENVSWMYESIYECEYVTVKLEGWTLMPHVI